MLAQGKGRIINTASLSLDEIMAEIRAADDAGQDVARLHSGDLSVWSAMGEQLRRLRDLGIAYDVTPGVPSFAASAASGRRFLAAAGAAGAEKTGAAERFIGSA